MLTETRATGVAMASEGRGGARGRGRRRTDDVEGVMRKGEGVCPVGVK